MQAFQTMIPTPYTFMLLGLVKAHNKMPPAYGWVQQGVRLCLQSAEECSVPELLLFWVLNWLKNRPRTIHDTELVYTCFNMLLKQRIDTQYTTLSSRQAYQIFKCKEMFRKLIDIAVKEKAN